jgi:hypothetical protein
VCPTSLTQLTNNYNDNYDGNTPQLVFSESTLNLSWTYNQWHGFGFDTPYIYDGTDNLIFEFKWQGDNGNTVLVFGWYPPGGNRVLDGFSLTNPTGSLRSYMNRLRIYYTVIGTEETSSTPVVVMNTPATPNPFVSSTTIRYRVENDAPVIISIHDHTGQLKKTLFDAQQKAGEYTASWDGTDDRGARLSTGVYFYCIKTPENVLTNKVLLID